MFARYLWIHTEFGDGEGIDPFVMRQEMVIPSFSVIRSAGFRTFVLNLVSLIYVRDGIKSTGVSRRNQL